MARLHQIFDSDDEDFPELSTLLGHPGMAAGQILDKPGPKQGKSDASPRKETHKVSVDTSITRDVTTKKSTKPSYGTESSKQRPLGTLKPTSITSLSLHNLQELKPEEARGYPTEISPRRSPKRQAKTRIDYSKFGPRISDVSFSSESDETLTDLSGFIVPDSASDEDIAPSRSLQRYREGSYTKKTGREPIVPNPLGSKSSFCIEAENTGPFCLTSPKKERKTSSKLVCPESPPRSTTPLRLSGSAEAHPDLDEPFSKLRFSPPRLKSPYKIADGVRPVTPPLGPPRSKLQSPSKRDRVPPSPHRPSIDAFWSADVINDWNEQYSPTKLLRSPRKNRLLSVKGDESDLSPSESPRKGPNRSPTKKDKKAIERRKAFELSKHSLATSFLREVDLAVASGQISALAESTGGIKINWSKKLSSTAGRANWKREIIRSKSADGALSAITHQHHASIDLAEKVIDDEDRLINVIAHEYCHLANFMISGIKDNPHGASFKIWAAKATRAFAHRNVNVTTKHTYEIAYKYIWICSSESCGLEYKRHSKSIDPAKHSCGSCKSKLVQVQPVPKKGEGTGKTSEYQEFVKREHETVRRENPDKGFGEIMVILGRKFREGKKAAATAGDEGGEPESIVEKRSNDSADLGDIARKLNFLNLAT